MEVEMGKFAWLPGQTEGTPLVDAGQTFLFDDDDWSFKMRIEFFFLKLVHNAGLV